MSAFSKLPLSFAVLVSLAGIACAANKIALSCTGTIASKETAFEQAPISPVSLLVDLDLAECLPTRRQPHHPKHEHTGSWS
jgi:hypothetical protein